MEYPAIITKEGRNTLATFPDCPGCQTFAGPGEDIAAMAAEALEGWLEVSLEHGDAPEPPSRPRARKVLWVAVEPVLATKLQFRWARLAANLSQKDVAERMGMTQPMVAKLERPGYTPGLDVASRAAAALGLLLAWVPAYKPGAFPARTSKGKGKRSRQSKT